MTGTIITISHHGFHLCWLYEALQGRVPEVPSSPSLTDNALISRGNLSASRRASAFIHPQDNPERLGPRAPVMGEETGADRH